MGGARLERAPPRGLRVRIESSGSP
jgi:hypothetical protein